MPARAMSALDARRAREAIVRRCHAGLEPDHLLADVASLLRAAVPFDGCVWSATDPSTLLISGAAVVDGIPEKACGPYWDHELLGDDANSFARLAANGPGVGVLGGAAGPPASSSARHREVYSPLGFTAELRATFSVDGRCWGLADLQRGSDRPPFSEAEVALVASVGPVIAAALRSAVLAGCGEGVLAARDPGTLTLSPGGELVAITPDAAGWLGEVDRGPLSPLGVRVPVEAQVVAAQARAHAAGRGTAPPRVRLRARTGRWLLLHGACLHAAGGPTGEVAITIQAAPAGDIAPLLAEAYALSPREQEVVGLLARGCSTNEVAQRLFISKYTVHDHVKSTLEKVGASHRGELIARIFAEHYVPKMYDIPPAAIA